jgi:hypothetical protein
LSGVHVQRHAGRHPANEAGREFDKVGFPHFADGHCESHVMMDEKRPEDGDAQVLHRLQIVFDVFVESDAFVASARHGLDTRNQLAHVATVHWRSQALQECRPSCDWHVGEVDHKPLIVGGHALELCWAKDLGARYDGVDRALGGGNIEHGTEPSAPILPDPKHANEHDSVLGAARPQ